MGSKCRKRANLKLFFRLTDIEDATSDGVRSALNAKYKDMLQTYELDWKAIGLVGGGSDGAAVNLGMRRGVLTLLKGECPWLVVTHYV